MYIRCMKVVRLLLLPLSLIYWIITALRNLFYSAGIFRQYSFGIPVIAIGNLSTGGTGKTPHAEYLIRLLARNYRVATLSRGYKRKSKGFILGSTDSSADVLGDEPFQFYQKFPNIRVAVDANRKNGIEQLLSLTPKPQVIILDDAYQHRRVKAGLYILLTSYGDFYTDDFMLPAGNLREGRVGAKRADVIVITKCPPLLSPQEQNKIVKKLELMENQQVYFSAIDYDDKAYAEVIQMETATVKISPKLLVTGIARPEPFYRHLQGLEDKRLTFPDHHNFTDGDLDIIIKEAGNNIIVTTEKDYVRLRGRLPEDKLFYLPIKCKFLNNSDKFDQTILNYVAKSTGNS